MGRWFPISSPDYVGWVALFCDGSVHFLSYDMEPLNHQQLGNRLDGELVDLGNL